MTQTIDQFMWSYQSIFCSNLERAATNLFDRIGFGLGPRAYLVGFTDDQTQPHATCFEPELDALASVDLSDVLNRANLLYESGPEAKMFYSVQRHHDLRHAAARDRATRRALADTLGESDPAREQIFFAGGRAHVGAYDVYPVIGVPTDRWRAKPSLTTAIKDRVPIVPSLQHALMEEILSAATAALRQQEQPDGPSGLGGFGHDSELMRRASRAQMQSTSVLAGDEFESGLHTALDMVAAQPYEGRAGAGRLILTDRSNAHLEMVISLVDHISISSTRSVRKALEMTGDDLALICDGQSIVGLGKVGGTYPASDESMFEFEVVGRGSWEMRHAGTAMLRVNNTMPVLPAPQVPKDTFVDTAKRIFPEVEPLDLNRLWGQVQAASRAAHGTMLVVHRHAPEEAARLMPQAQRITPVHLDTSTLAAMTAIDGAVLLDQTGRCHAVGVILDGTASGIGDSGRGARFNSAIRYQSATGTDCLIVIVSEDGMIDLLPNLRRRIERSSVEKVVSEVEKEAAAISPQRNYSAFFRAWRHLEAVCFYLDEDQCTRANLARTHVEEDRGKKSSMVVGWVPIQVDPGMNDEHWL